MLSPDQAARARYDVGPLVHGVRLRRMELAPGASSDAAAGRLAALAALAARAAGAPTAVIHVAVGDTLRLAGACGLPPRWADLRHAAAGGTVAGLVMTQEYP